MRVRPKTFFFNNMGNLTPDQYKQKVDAVKKELKKSAFYDNSRYKDLPLAPNSTVEKANVLVLEFKSPLKLPPNNYKKL